jgi:hypothetical protein
MNKKHDYVPFTEIEERIAHKVVEGRDKAAVRFPLVFGLLASFGIVSVFYGFEALINKVDWLRDNPWAMLLVGVSTLIATGTAYKKLN